ncbi:glycosyltransferase family 39 protein [Streptomyces pathocidini]|uniref:Glycosyltransferase family 39 protein n=1 Tax=Streptomyces pathocidini TaxID=1650571 RepID=A0ABW7UTM5_9ACTN|nr:glycosyltransferase family 39 protein [Streptomyces pathocidini]
MVTTQVKIPLRPVSLARRTPVAALLVPAVTMALLGLWDLGRRGQWGDEAATWSAARRTPGQLWDLVWHIDAAHGLYYLLIHGVLRIHADDVALRLPSVAGMTLAAALISAIGARLAGARVGLVAGMLFAVVPIVSLYAQEGRSYALVLAGAMACTYFLVRACETGEGRWWRRYALVAAVTAVLHAFSLLVLAAHAVTLLVGRAGAREWRCWGLSTGFALAAVAPVAWVARGQADEALSWMTAPGWDAVTGLVRSFAGPSGWIACAMLLLAAAALITPRRPALDSGPVSLATVALPLLAVPPALLIAVSQVHPLYDQRYVLYALPGLSLLAASGIDRLTGLVLARGAMPLAMPLAAALVVSLVLGGQLGAQRHVRSGESRLDDLRPIAEMVRAEAKPGDAVVFLAGTRRKAAIAYPKDFKGLRDVALDRSPAASGTLFGTELPPDRLKEALSKAQRIWLLDREDSDQRRVFSDPRERVKQEVLSDEFHREGVERLHGGSVHLYVHN